MKTARVPASAKRHRGFGLIEILVTLGVLSVGIVGVTTLHATLTQQSRENKSRVEALAIAQSRIEDLRNYTGTVASLAEFNTLFADTNGFTNSTSIAGTNAVFTRAERIASGPLKALTVRVTWTAPDNDSRAVSLHTRLGYVSPSGIGVAVLDAAGSVVGTPMGSARLGKGEVPAHVQTSSNGDGTSRYREGADLLLVSGGRIVLTLSGACQTGDTCGDFARINGRVWIDRVSQRSLTPGEVSVVASGAAFCARYYTSHGTRVVVTPSTTAAVSTGTGDYEYFDYTCYVSRGWYGNVGIVLAGGLDGVDKVCMGDPVAEHAAAAPVIASRRVYRGMVYKRDANSDSGKEEVGDGNGGTTVRYYSHGIADGVEVPAPGSGHTTHDFVIGSFPQHLTEGAHCVSQGVMARADSTVNGEPGALFAHMPTDFICLNDGYLDAYDTAVYGSDSTCPYRPDGAQP